MEVSRAVPVEGAETPEVYDAQVVAMFPPRPDAITTLLHDDDFLPGVQTLLYSIKKTLSTKQTYAPEVVVLVTPNVNASKAAELLCPALCTRFLPIQEWRPPSKTVDQNLGKKQAWKRTLDNHNPGWTKLRIFGLQQYDTILYIDSDCLVLKDVSSLLELNKVYTESEALIAAAPDLFPSNHFNSGVMVIRPSTSVMETMERHASLLTTFDGSDTGFLNAYFNTWYTEFPPMARLSVGYNAQEAMYDMTVDQEDGSSSFWDVQVASDLTIVHYSNPKKPWQSGGDIVSKKKKPLHTLWKTWHTKSKNYLTRFQKERAKEARMLQEQEEEAKAKNQVASRQQPQQRPRSQASNPHKLVQKRYKTLRAEGKSTQEAMQQARAEILPGSDQEVDVGTQVAAMFGMR